MMQAAAPLPFNPADYFTYVLDQEIRAAGLPGGYCGFALELAAAPDLARLQQRLDYLVEHFPRASARIERQGKRYAWIYTDQPIALERHDGGSEGEATQAVLLEVFNRHETRPLALHWIAQGQGGTLLLVWNHPLMELEAPRSCWTSSRPTGRKASRSRRP
ncbi:hypothetical protein [Methylogaea oryzae]|uniref:hypothetical protein n=1 Tax=Methylogaea oryzae TaxID=1295382 RepID=UPI00159B85D0|nr:hypothetical protein [Methylogaea oryzae]